MIEWKPMKKFADPYYLKGKEKAEVLNEMFDFVTYFDNMSCPSQHEKELYYTACIYLEAEATRRVRAFEISARLYSNRKIDIANKELDAYKMRLKLEFMEKYKTQMESKEFTPEMIRELRQLNKMEKLGCYLINDLKIMKKDCNTCESRICSKERNEE
jgi:hypothetical protein